MNKPDINKYTNEKYNVVSWVDYACALEKYCTKLERELQKREKDPKRVNNILKTINSCENRSRIEIKNINRILKRYPELNDNADDLKSINYSLDFIHSRFMILRTKFEYEIMDKTFGMEKPDYD